jgi:hypothetical protein
MESVNLIAQRLAEMQSAASSGSDGEDTMPKRPRMYNYQKRQIDGMLHAPFQSFGEQRPWPVRVGEIGLKGVGFTRQQSNLWVSPMTPSRPSQELRCPSWGDQMMVSPS